MLDGQTWRPEDKLAASLGGASVPSSPLGGMSSEGLRLEFFESTAPDPEYAALERSAQPPAGIDEGCPARSGRRATFHAAPEMEFPGLQRDPSNFGAHADAGAGALRSAAGTFNRSGTPAPEMPGRRSPDGIGPRLSAGEWPGHRRTA